MQRYSDPGPGPGNGMTWQQFHDEWRALHEELKDRDIAHMEMLEDIRDSLGAVHVRFEQLPCNEHKITMSHISTDLETLKARTPDWKAVGEALPIFRPRVVMAILGAVATMAGWEWWERIASTAERWLQ